MRGRLVSVASVDAMLLALAGCGSFPKPPSQTAQLSYQETDLDLSAPGNILSFVGPRTGLAGRTIKVTSIADLQLARNEVVLTFDDGPIPRKTPAILDALDRHGVKATFLMVGEMARSYPDLVRKVAARGHAIGTHTQGHKNLASVGFDAAVNEITQGRQSVAAALIPTGFTPAPFFRFPYLSDTPRLRQHLSSRGVVVIDVDVDSKDYFVSTRAQVRERTLASLEKRGSGIILLHDLHQRTVDMLPQLLDDLHSRGYKVVNLQPAQSPSDEILASLVN
jgi:peptidoglycan/xylan/chitin deacetylase (PgdA/CDA1 family)